MPGFAWRREKSHVMPRARKCPSGAVERNTRLVFGSGRSIAPDALDSPGVRHSEHPLAR